MTFGIRTRRLLGALAALAAALSLGACAPMNSTTGPLVLESQGSFFVGGRDMKSDTLSSMPAYEASGTVTVEQMYVRYQTPPGGAKNYLIVMIHGCCLTGKTWETTPDGRMGWPVYVINQASRSRSAANAPPGTAVKMGKAPTDKLPTIFAAGHEGAWAIFRFGKQYPEVLPGMQFPVEAQGEFWKQMVPDWLFSLPTPNPTVPSLSELSIRLNGAILMSHSQSGIYPFQPAALSPRGIAGIVAVEPSVFPAPDGDLKPYLGMPIMVLYGDYVDMFQRWAPRLKLCRAISSRL
ncbi:MAG: esterase [Candidatus Protistobacter heckmanni]|nr:esterase [Candidatus Protistobacter heckmanni]